MKNTYELYMNLKNGKFIHHIDIEENFLVTELERICAHGILVKFDKNTSPYQIEDESMFISPYQIESINIKLLERVQNISDVDSAIKSVLTDKN